MSGYHRLPPTILTSLAGGGDQAERDVLRAGQVSKRLAQLRAILDATRDLPDVAKAAEFEESFDVLATVQRRDAGVVAELLGGPQVGAWASWCLRRLTRGGDAAGATPLWVHLAHLGGVAAAAAVRSGAEVRVRVPVRAGAVVIPAVGRASVATTDTWSLTDCATGPDGLRFDDKPAVDWEPVRTVRAEAGGVVLEAQIDEIDPYWRSFGIPISDRLTDDAVGRWRGWVERAWQVLAERHPHRLDTLAAAIRCLVPVEQGGRLGRVSASSVDAAGAVALTEPTNAVRLAATLIHESQHFRLNALHDLRPLFREPTGALLYSPWRNDARALPGVVHGAMAFLGVADFWRRERPGQVADFEYARHVRQLRLAMDVAEGAGELTEFGHAVVGTLGAAIAALPTDRGPAEVRRLADDLVAEHRARWRLTNVTPADEAVDAAARAWRRGGRLPDDAPGTTRPSAPSGDNPLIRLAMAWQHDPDEVRELAEDNAALTGRFPGTTARDLHLLSGDYPAARAAALTRIETGTADERDWSALTVAHAHHCDDPAASPLVTRPELVMAAWHRIGGQTPAALRTLLTTYEAGTSTSDSIRR